MGSFRGKNDYHYQTLRTNVDLLKLIQLGITLFTEAGEQPPQRPQSSDSGVDFNMPGGRRPNGVAMLPCTWQFNFKFSLKDDMYSQTSIDALVNAGVDFAALERDGIDPFNFGALLISSGMVCDEDVRWISCHGGYDFGYLTKLMICKPLPDDEVEFDILMRKFFPATYDIKHLVKHAIRRLSSGSTPLDSAMVDLMAKLEGKTSLENLAEALKVKRTGSQHQAGPEAQLCGNVFFKIRERFYDGEISDDHLNQLWGLGSAETVSTQGYQGAVSQQYSQDNSNTGINNAYTNGGPSTPNNNHANMVSTPAATTNSSGIGAMTPGGGGGVFGAFQFGK